MTNLSKAFKGAKVLITCHTGFKGSWLSLWLRNLGSEVHGISYLPPSDPNMFESLGIENKIESFHKLNIADNSTEVNKIINIINPDFIFHLAATFSFRFLSRSSIYNKN